MPHAELNTLDIFPIYAETVLSFILQFFVLDSHVHDRGLHLSIVIMISHSLISLNPLYQYWLSWVCVEDCLT